MFRIALFATTIALLSVPAGQTWARGNRAELISQRDAGRFGLERVWFTRVAIDSSRGEISHVGQHVSSTRSYTVYELAHDRGKLVFSERDFDRFGKRLGKAGAHRQAKLKAEELELLELNPKLTDRTIQEINLYVATNRGVVQAIDAETGRTLWVTETGPAGQAIRAVGANDEFVAAVNVSTVYVLSAADGKIVWQRKVRGAPSAGPILTQDLLFAPLLGGTVEIHQLKAEDGIPRSFQSTGHVGRPIFTGRVVAWPSDRGHLYIAQPDTNNILFQVETGHSIDASATALHPGRLLAASTGGYVYCIDEETGKILWRFSTGEPIRLSPLVVGEAAFITTEGGNLFRIHGKTGTEDWIQPAPGVHRVLAASEERLYCVSTTGRLLILDAESGGRFGVLASTVPAVQVENKLTDRIFIGTRGGFIQCLRERNNEWPVIHLSAAELAAPQPSDERSTPMTEDPVTAPLDATPTEEPDPFSGFGDSDPFATDADDVDPFKESTGSTDEPTPEVSDSPFDSPF